MKSILEVVRDLIKPYIDRNANNIAPVEVSPVENPYYVGDQLIYNGVLYTVTNDVTIDDDLEVGVNITPSQNVLNQLSTAGSDMVGATSSANGTHGLVPQPLAGEQNKYLRGDGSWTSSDVTPTANSINNVQSGGVKTELDKKLPTYANDSTVWDTAPTASSTKPVTSGGVKTELDKKLPTYANGTSSWDTTPTSGSTKPVTSGGVYSAIPSLSYVGMVIHSTTLNTEAKVKAYYGGTKWIQHSGYVLRGATSGVTSNSATKTGGTDSVTLTVNQIPSHTHDYAMISSSVSYKDTAVGETYGEKTRESGARGGGQAFSNIPNYKSVYIWERTQ